MCGRRTKGNYDLHCTWDVDYFGTKFGSGLATKSFSTVPPVAYCYKFDPSNFLRIPIVWDDMLRNLLPTEMAQLAAAGVEPMVWWYGEDIYRFIPTYTWDRLVV